MSLVEKQLKELMIDSMCEDEIQELNKQLSNRICKLRHERENKKSQELVGKCFKYLNSYSHGEDWWLYKKVIAACGEHVTCRLFQQTAKGEFILEESQRHASSNLGQEITSEEYDQAAIDFLNEAYEVIRDQPRPEEKDGEHC